MIWCRDRKFERNWLGTQFSWNNSISSEFEWDVNIMFWSPEHRKKKTLFWKLKRLQKENEKCIELKKKYHIGIWSKVWSMVRLSGINEICKKQNYDGQRLESVCLLHIYVQVHAPPPLLGSTKTKTISSCHAKTNITPSQMICEAKSIITRQRRM